MKLRGSFGQLTGPRTGQNDAFRLSSCAVFLADGVGDSEDAHAVASLSCERAVATDWNRGTVPHTVSDLVFDLAKHISDRGLNGATTLCGAVLAGDNALWFVSVGDSRGYLLRDGACIASSRPHNDYFDRLLFDPRDASGALNVVTQAVNQNGDAVPDLTVISAEAGDVVLLMSDGVDGLLTLRETAALAVRALSSSDDAAEAVVSVLVECEKRGLTDNTTLGVFTVE